MSTAVWTTNRPSMASDPTPKPIPPMTPLVSYDHPAGLDIVCPKCQISNVPLRSGVLKAYIMRRQTERGLVYDCWQCSTVWPAGG